MNLADAALKVLQTADAEEKAHLTHRLYQDWQNADKGTLQPVSMPDRPARPYKPELRHPSEMPKRKKAGSRRGRVALLHALAHIELNAIDLAWDIIGRFAGYFQASDGFALPIDFYEDWLNVANDEAKHFLMLQQRLTEFDAAYGDLPAHDGLWEAAEQTRDDFAARLAIVPMVLEARGLDVTPQMIEMMKRHEDFETAALLQIIHDDEITHVRAGTVWFDQWCDYHQKDGEEYWQFLVRKYFRGNLKKPFNHDSREKAGMIADWYEPLAEAVS